MKYEIPAARRKRQDNSIQNLGTALQKYRLCYLQSHEHVMIWHYRCANGTAVKDTDLPWR
jgi:hypothetical protein